jgi:hypothetical protein
MSMLKRCIGLRYPRRRNRSLRNSSRPLKLILRQGGLNRGREMKRVSITLLLMEDLGAI